MRAAGGVFRVFIYREIMAEDKKISVGGQAVIEGVMMRSPEYVSVAVRKPDGRILVKREAFLSWTKRFKVMGWPFVRGGVTLIESMVLGIRALNFSGEVAMTEEEREKAKNKAESKKDGAWQRFTMGATVVFALGLGLLLFFYVPLLLTDWVGVGDSGLMFNLVDGGFRLVIFLLYLFLISRWKEIRRVFEYHGAEHQSIFAFEDGKELVPENASAYTTHHPRCGTSFLLVVMLVSILVFVFLGRPHTVSDRLIRLLFVPVIGGLSYEIIRLSAKPSGRWLALSLTAPGLWLQRITTQRPDTSQLEVALAALKSALDMDLGPEVDIATAENEA